MIILEYIFVSILKKYCLLFLALREEAILSDSALFLIDTSFDACKLVDDEDGNLPIHIEIDMKFYYALSKLIWLPWVKLIASNLPLHRAIMNNTGTSSSLTTIVEAIPLLIEKYPAALTYTDEYSDLPIHLESD
jgi:hypothetical protein